MSDQIPFILGVLALLATPGPTNTLMAAAGAQRGVTRSLPLLASEVLGYFIAITAWTELVGAATATLPWVPVAAKLVAAAFLLWSAWKLWRSAGQTDFARRGIGLSQVFVTTLINPKALVFAFAIFPPVDFMARQPYLAIFAGLVVITAVGWITLGMMAERRSAGLLTSSRIERITAVALAIFATLLVVSTIEPLL